MKTNKKLEKEKDFFKRSTVQFWWKNYFFVSHLPYGEVYKEWGTECVGVQREAVVDESRAEPEVVVDQSLLPQVGGPTKCDIQLLKWSAEPEVV